VSSLAFAAAIGPGDRQRPTKDRHPRAAPDERTAAAEIPEGPVATYSRRKGVFETEPGRLSRRELEVLGHLQQGLTNRQIADRLYISTNTINKHVQQVLRKLQVNNRVQAAVRGGSFAA
jgi:DNA-binding NarL/FixJ family response regulator